MGFDIEEEEEVGEFGIDFGGRRFVGGGGTLTLLLRT